ncbi:MAG: esterase [Campylobacteraceae bacterium]|nr:esterase [Campylobacteraceae bacterium]
MIIYIHGFASSGFGGKATLFKKHYADDIFCPTLSHIPALAINTLEQLIQIHLKNNEKIHLIGSSLGGFYAIYLANKYNLKAVLINPAIFPYKTLDKIGMVTHYFDMSTFEVTKTHLDFLKSLETSFLTDEKNFMLLLQKGDETLDYEEAVLKLSNANVIIEEGGNHTFEGIERYFETIDCFFN